MRVFSIFISATQFTNISLHLLVFPFSSPSIVRVRSTEEIQRFMQQKQKEAEGEIQAKQEAREIKKILSGGM